MSLAWTIALVVLVLSHVFTFCLGVAAYHLLRMVNMRPLMPKQPMSEAKLFAAADKIAKAQINAERYAHFDRNQMAVPVPELQENVEESFAPSKKR